MDAANLFNLGAFALQTGAIVAVAALLLGLLRVSSPGTRYTCWRMVLLACLVMPWLLTQHAEPVQLADAETLTGAFVPAAIGAGIIGAPPQPVMPVPAAPVPWDRFVLFVILAGAAVRATWLAIGWLRLRRLRTRGFVIDDDEYREIQDRLGTQATVKAVAGLTQPATFGLRQPVVLIPAALADSPATLRRAVVTHELFHVQRRDWLWVIGEEALRTILWFHPAILWLTSRIQLAREEVVDELTVLATGNRRAYIEALCAFADAGPVRPAPAFARRRHLFTRIVRLSKESVMSSPRRVLSAATVIAAVLGTGWYASSVFPIVSAAAPGEPPVIAAKINAAPVSRGQSDRESTVRAAQDGTSVSTGSTSGILIVDQSDLQTLRRRLDAQVAAQGARSGGPRPGPASVATSDPAPGTKPITPENPIPRRLSSVPIPYPPQLRGSGYRATVMLRVTVDSSGAVADALVARLESGSATGPTPAPSGVEAQAFVAAATDAVKQWRYQPPADPPIAFFVYVRFDGERDAIATQSDAPTVAQVGVVFSTNDVLRQQLADYEKRLEVLRETRALAAERLTSQHPDVVQIDKQIADMERELERARTQGTLVATLQPGATAGARMAGPGSVAGKPVRVGGTIRLPAKTKHVNPAYPEVAQAGRVQGVVITELTIDEQGRVAEARVLRSIPLLDQAALEAVTQWEFTPTLLNGSAVPVIMTVTVQFSLN